VFQSDGRPFRDSQQLSPNVLKNWITGTLLH
jgi:hypothetical protein